MPRKWDRAEWERAQDEFAALLKPYDLRRSYKPEEPIRYNEYVGRGWHPIVKRLVEDLIALGWNREVAQIKEKLGGLRFYIGSGNEAIFQRINAAGDESYRTCETCGAAGKHRVSESGWHATRCDACWAKDSRLRDDDEASRKEEP